MLLLFTLLGCESEKRVFLGANTKESKELDDSSVLTDLEFAPFQIHQLVADTVQKDKFKYLEKAQNVSIDWQFSNKIILLSKHSSYSDPNNESQGLSVFILPSSDRVNQKLEKIDDNFFDDLSEQFKEIAKTGKYVPAFKPDATEESSITSGLFHIQSESDIGIGITTISILKSPSIWSSSKQRLQGVVFPHWPAHPIFQNMHFELVPVPTQGYTLATICWGGVNKHHWPHTKDSDTPFLQNTIQFKNPTDSLKEDQKKSILRGKNVSKDNLEHNYCQLWSLPIKDNKLDPYFDKQPYLIGDLTEEGDEEKHKWNVNSKDPRLNPSSPYELSWSDIKQLNQKLVNKISTQETVQTQNQQNIGVSKSEKDMSEEGNDRISVVSQPILTKVACSKRLDANSLYFKHADIWLINLTLPLTIDKGQFVTSKTEKSEKDQRLLCAYMNVFFKGFHNAAQCRPDVVFYDREFKNLEPCLQELQDSNLIILERKSNE